MLVAVLIRKVKKGLNYMSVMFFYGFLYLEMIQHWCYKI